MKKLLTKLTLSFLLTAGLVACQKETDVLKEENEEIVSGRSTPGPMEFMQRGANGAVVIYSSWINKTNDNWTGFGTNEIVTNLAAPGLSTEIMNTGVVLVYAEVGGVISILPTVWFDENYLYASDFTFVKQKITIKIRLIGAMIPSVEDVRYRYILIPGTSQGGRMNAPVNYKDYRAVCEYYGIPK